MKRTYITTFLTCIAVLCLFFGISRTRNISGAMSEITVGFIYESDESAPYSYNFSRAAVLLKEELHDSVNIENQEQCPGRRNRRHAARSFPSRVSRSSSQTVSSENISHARGRVPRHSDLPDQ